MTEQITVEVPEDFLEVIGPDAGREMLQAAVLRWFEEGRLSQGQAANILGMKRSVFFDLLREHRISPIQMSVEELDEDFRRG